MAPALPMHGRMMHSTDGTLTFQSYSASGDRAINSIGRGALNETLLDAAEATPGVTLHFGARSAAYDLAIAGYFAGVDAAAARAVYRTVG